MERKRELSFPRVQYTFVITYLFMGTHTIPYHAIPMPCHAMPCLLSSLLFSSLLFSILSHTTLTNPNQRHHTTHLLQYTSIASSYWNTIHDIMSCHIISYLTSNLFILLFFCFLEDDELLILFILFCIDWFCTLILTLFYTLCPVLQPVKSIRVKEGHTRPTCGEFVIK